MPPEPFSNLIWLLLPLAAASGWYLASRGGAHRRGEPPTLSKDYFKGLNYLLNEQPDKAIDVFIAMLEVESDTIETQLALGNLFRRRGEVDRAIRIHQNLITHSALGDEQRSLAALELGMDYMRSGLFDRAERLFKSLLDSGTHTKKALSQLLDIYQQEQDWDKAIACAREIETRCKEDMGRITAQFYCEWAQQCELQGQTAEAVRLLQRGLEVDPGCARASLMEGRIAEASSDTRAAVMAFKRIEHQDPSVLVQALPHLLECYRSLGQSNELIAYLQTLVAKKFDVHILLMLADLIAEERGIEAAISYLSEELNRRPSLRGLNQMLKYSNAHGAALSKPQLTVLSDYVGRLLRHRSNYQCQHCGFLAKTHHWQCPTCKHWNSMRPVDDLDGN